MRIIKRITDKTIAATIAVVLVLALIIAAFPVVFNRGSAAEDTKEFAPSSLELANTQFSESSGSYPASPTGWTGAHAVGSGNVVSGVIDLSDSAYFGENSGNKEFKLDQYPEYASDSSKPVTVFGTDSHKDTDAKTLMINTERGAEVAYAYSSGDMTFSPNSFYRVSAWVKTGDFAEGTGATIKLSGLGENCSFLNINTVNGLKKENGLPVLNKENDFGWVKYSFYVRTSASLSSTVKLVLGLGDTVNNDDEDPEIMPRYAHGYAFFDTVEAERISSHDFAFETANLEKSETRDNLYVDAAGTTIALDLYDAEYLKDGNGNDIGTFSDGLKGWTKNIPYDADDEDEPFGGAANAYTYDSFSVIDPEDNSHGFTANPWSPLGRAEDTDTIDNGMLGGTNGNILVISTYNNSGKFEAAALGVASPEYNIKRFGYYRFGVWIKTDGADGGSGASIGVKGTSNNPADNYKLTQWYTTLGGDETDLAHYGWKEHVVYIKGSVRSDCKAHFELWFGSPSSKSRGIAMFDNATFTELSYSEFSAMSSADGGSVITLDESEESTGVANGSFQNVGDIVDDDTSYPLPVASWTRYTPDDAATTGFSSAKVNTDNIISGLIPTDKDTFDSFADDIGVENPAGYENPPLYNALLLSSHTKTAFCYRSSELTVATDKAYKLTVDMAVTNVDGYGASLVLKTADGRVLSTIEGIKNTHNAFKTFTFYIDKPLADQSVCVEIWLGLNDRKNNTHKLSAGTVYVKNVAFTEWTVGDDESTTIDAEYTKVFDKYISDLNNTALLDTLDYGVFSFSKPSLDYYDAYSYRLFNEYAPAYQWIAASQSSEAAKSGVVNTDNMHNISVYDGFKYNAADQNGAEQSGSMLVIDHAAPTNTIYTLANNLNLAASTYYRLDVTIKIHTTDDTRLSDVIEGATIGLNGAVTEKFENIKDTTTLVAENQEDSRDRETYKTFSFYISSGDNGGELGMYIMFGGKTQRTFTDGQLIVSDISLTSINNTVYENIVDELKEYEKKHKEEDKYRKAVALSETAVPDDDKTEKTPSEVAWWIIPTVIFGVCLIAAIVLILVTRLRDRAKRKKKVTVTTEYDRAETIKELDRLAQLDEDEKKADKKAQADDSPADEFDEQPSGDEDAPAANDEPSESDVQAEPEQTEKAPDAADDLDD